MNYTIETIEKNGYTVKIIQDDDCMNPREDTDLNFLFLGLPHRRYSIGDETIDPATFYTTCETCETCGGEGRDTTLDTDPVWNADDTLASFGVNAPDCPDCDGSGELHARDMRELVEMIKQHYGARVVLPVGMIDHSGTSYYIGGGAHWCDPGGWDSGTCGFILDTPDRLKEWGAENLTDEQLIEQMTNEIKVLDQWSTGDCYGYVVEDINGDMVDSCWGFIGMDNVREEALAAVPDAPVEKLYTVSMTEHQWTLVAECLENSGDGHELALATSIRLVLP